MGERRAFRCNDTATTEIYALSLHHALPIFAVTVVVADGEPVTDGSQAELCAGVPDAEAGGAGGPDAIAGCAVGVLVGLHDVVLAVTVDVAGPHPTGHAFDMQCSRGQRARGG